MNKEFSERIFRLESYRMKINGLILAAGMSSRMGDFKPLMKINNKSIIEQTIDSMLNSGVNYVTVVLGYRGEEIESMLRNNGYLARRPAVFFTAK